MATRSTTVQITMPQMGESVSEGTVLEWLKQVGDRVEADLVDVAFPEMGDSVSEGTVLEWLKQPGDSVAVDEPLVEISTDKVDAEVPSPVTGTLAEILVEADETVGVGTVLCRIAGGGSPRPPLTAGGPGGGRG